MHKSEVKYMYINILISMKSAKKLIAARQYAILIDKAELYWEKVRIQEDGCVAARQMEIEAARIGKR